MAISKTTGFVDSNGVIHASVEDAQAAEVKVLIGHVDGSAGIPDADLDRFASDLVRNHAEALLAILTIGPRSRPKARKAAGTTNPKRATKAQVKAGLKGMREAADGAEAAPAPELESSAA